MQQFRTALAIQAAALAAAGAAALAGPARAEPQPRHLTCSRPGELTLEVTRVLDGDTFKVADGREVRLVGSLAPAPPAGTTAETWIPAVDARRHLAALIEGRNIVLATGANRRTDRWGRLLGQVYVDAPTVGAASPIPLVGEEQGGGRNEGGGRDEQGGEPRTSGSGLPPTKGPSRQGGRRASDLGPGRDDRRRPRPRLRAARQHELPRRHDSPRAERT